MFRHFSTVVSCSFRAQKFSYPKTYEKCVGRNSDSWHSSKVCLIYLSLCCSVLLQKVVLFRQIWYRINDMSVLKQFLGADELSEVKVWEVTFISSNTKSIPAFGLWYFKRKTTPTTFYYIKPIKIIFIQEFSRTVSFIYCGNQRCLFCHNCILCITNELIILWCYIRLKRCQLFVANIFKNEIISIIQIFLIHKLFDSRNI